MGKRGKGKRRRGKKGGHQGRYGVLRYHGKKWYSVFNQLYYSWRHPASPAKPRPSQVVRIIGVTPPRYLVARYHRYRRAIGKRRRMKHGNERRRWHGTKANCKFFSANLPSRGRCDDKSCTICSIINTGFRIPKPAGQSLLFGYGIYLSSTASKSDDYNGPKNTVRALLLCKVCVGRGYKLQTPANNLTKPPRGYDSVLGEPGGSINFDELVVYTPAAVLPAYIFVYK